MSSIKVKSGIRKRQLYAAYRNNPRIGIVAGAGVTANTGVLTFSALVLRMLEYMQKNNLIRESHGWISPFIAKQRQALYTEDSKTISPEEIAVFIKENLEEKKISFEKLLKNALYQDASVSSIVSRSAFEQNSTLNAIISFCAARPNTNIASLPKKKNNQDNSAKSSIETNSKIGGILTTNYDNLIEGAFHTKYRVKRLKPVTRPTSLEEIKGRIVIPVYHIHGYIRYLGSEDEVDDETPPVIMSEIDYINSFYDPLGFSNYISMSFLRKFPCIFIGSAMTDKNLRRYLYHLNKNKVKPKTLDNKFAILHLADTTQPEFTDNILESYGVKTIWIKDFIEIYHILKSMYTSYEGITEEDWDYVVNYRWP